MSIASVGRVERAHRVMRCRWSVSTRGSRSARSSSLPGHPSARRSCRASSPIAPSGRSRSCAAGWVAPARNRAASTCTEGCAVRTVRRARPTILAVRPIEVRAAMASVSVRRVRGARLHDRVPVDLDRSGQARVARVRPGRARAVPWGRLPRVRPVRVRVARATTVVRACVPPSCRASGSPEPIAAERRHVGFAQAPRQRAGIASGERGRRPTRTSSTSTATAAAPRPATIGTRSVADSLTTIPTYAHTMTRP